MPFIEILAPPATAKQRQAIARVVTDGLSGAFSVGPEPMTVYFIDITPDHYAHAGAAGMSQNHQRIFVKLHAFRRDVGARRAAAAALTPGLAAAYGTPAAEIAIY